MTTYAFSTQSLHGFPEASRHQKIADFRCASVFSRRGVLSAATEKAGDWSLPRARSGGGKVYCLLNQFTGLLPPEGVKILLVLFLSFLIGLEREERSMGFGTPSYSFGGVRTYPLIGLIGYALALLSGNELMPVMVGFAVVAGFLWLSYKNKLDHAGTAGVTSEVSALTTYVVGALVSHGQFWIATTLAVLSLLLLELKALLEGLSHKLPADEILAFTKFLLLTAVILPIVPNRVFGPFGFNPFKMWLIVVAASGISYGSYLLQQLERGQGSVFVSALLGGAYSSTLTTAVLAKRCKPESAPRVWSGAILMASGVMYLRLLVLVGIFNHDLMKLLLRPFLFLGVGAIAGGWLWARSQGKAPQSEKHAMEAKNPLELSAAFLFAALFVVLLAATHYAIKYLGQGGVYGLAALTGVTDIDPFILGLTQSGGAGASLQVAVGGISIAAASNNVVKGFYAYGFADRKTGLQALLLLLGLAALGILLPLAGRML